MSKEGASKFPVAAEGVHEQLRRLGLEWKTADWAHDQQVVITIAPVVDQSEAMKLRARLDGVAEAIEGY